jgi:hypothetical protein
MVALESLIVREERQDSSTLFIESLIEIAANQELDDRASIIGGLKELRYESIGRSGRKLVARLGDRQYNDLSSIKFFNYCYGLRSDLVHGNDPRPSRSEVDLAAAGLEVLLSDLFAEY